MISSNAVFHDHMEVNLTVKPKKANAFLSELKRKARCHSVVFTFRALMQLKTVKSAAGILEQNDALFHSFGSNGHGKRVNLSQSFVQTEIQRVVGEQAADRIAVALEFLNKSTQ